MRIVLAFDGDEAGQRATEEGGLRLLYLLNTWGKARTDGPAAQALATAQEAHSTLAHRCALVEGVLSVSGHSDASEIHSLLARLEEEIEWVGVHIEELHRREINGEDKDHLAALTADEYIESQKPHTVLEDVGAIDWEDRKQRADLVSFVSRFTDLTLKGRTWRGKCPLDDHDDSTPSFHVYPEKRNWNCFGCHKWGDIFDLARAKGVPFNDI